MEKVSVIIPTLNKNNIILQSLISCLEEDDTISEIIIINNTTKPFSPDLYGNKLKIITPETNLYVNSSWNLGISHAENDIFLIINDDILCCKSLCSSVLNTKILDNDTTGLIGLDNRYIKNFICNNFNYKIFLDLVNNSNCDNIEIIEMHDILKTEFWGSAFFGRKKNYFMIPDYLKIIYGDNFLLFKNVQKGNINYMISNVNFNHVKSLTSLRPEFKCILEQDLNNWNLLYRQRVHEVLYDNAD